jgi:hypothetical protein
MNRNRATDNLGWDVSFWFAALSPLIGIALGFATAAVMAL